MNVGNKRENRPIQTKSETFFVKKSCRPASAKNRKKRTVLKSRRDDGRSENIIFLKKYAGK